MKKTIISIATIFLFLLFSCKKDEGSLVIYGLRGPSGIAMIKLFEDVPNIKGFNVSVEALAQSDLMTARFISGEAKVGILPPNVAAKIFTTGAADIRVAAVTGTGMLSLLSSDTSVQSINDLKGRTVYATGHGTVVDYVFRRILRFYDLEPDVDVMLNYSLAYPEVTQSLIAGRIDIALVPEPFATMAMLGKPDLHSVSDIQEEWKTTLRFSSRDDITDQAYVYPTTVLVVEGSFADNNPEAVSVILDAVKSSIQWVVANPKEAAQLVEKHDLAIRANVAEAAIPKSNYTFIPAIEAKSSLEEVFSIFLRSDPASIGGSLPANEFYLQLQ